MLAGCNTIGHNWLDEAKSVAKQDINIIIPQGAQVSVISFDSEAITVHQDWTTNKASAIYAIDAIPAPGSMTPIADALCFAAQRLNEVDGTNEYIFMYTDGNENASYGGQENFCDLCDPQIGVWYTDCDPADNDPLCSEWQNCLFDRLSGAGIFSFRFFGNADTSRHYREVIETSGELSSPSRSPNQQFYPDLVYFQYLADITGGELLFIPCEDPGPDLDGDGIGDDQDNCWGYNPLQTDTDDDGIGDVCEDSSGVYLDDVTERVGNSVDSIWAGQPITFTFRLANRYEHNIIYQTTGCRIYSPDGASWGMTSGEFRPEYEYFMGTAVIEPVDVDGISPDTLGVGGTYLLTDGIPDGYLGVLWSITIGPIDPSNHGKTICIDSTYYPPAGIWAWGYEGSGLIPPDWDGPHCFTIVSCQDAGKTTLDGEYENDEYGFSVAGGEDIDGDGVPDYIVGAPFYDNVLNNRGQVYMYSGIDGSLIRTYWGESEEDNLGQAVALAPDLSGDGIAEVIIGMPNRYHPSLGYRPGMVIVLKGDDWSPIFYLDLGDDGDQIGYSLGVVGDIDGDGISDILVGAPRDDGPENSTADAGAVFVLSGADGEIIRALYGSSNKVKFGSSVAGLGDVDTDDVPDFIVGAPSYTSVYAWRGRARVVSGATGETIRYHYGQAMSDYLGTCVAGLGDIDGDEVDDYVIGAPYNDAGGMDAGRAYVFSGATGSSIFEFTGESGGDRLGIAVADAGDVNGDGYSDIMVGASGHDGGGSGQGAVYIYSGLDGVALRILYGSSASVPDNAAYGEAVAGIGDINADCFADILVGSPQAAAPVSTQNGRAYIYEMIDNCNPYPVCPTDYLCGDANADGTLNVGDAVYLINYIFKNGPTPIPLCIGDANGDGAINVGDAVYMINYVFKGGPSPVTTCCP
ncbi:MAG: VWA domain-containing protein [FCB group bacterium]|nr:VWA domain-containing protein [FCB group bacterium]